MKRVVLTGGSGKLGRAAVAHLVEHGYQVLSLDRVAPAQPRSPFAVIDFTDYGQTLEAVLGGIDERRGPFDAVVHLAAVPAPGLTANTATFRNNLPATYNVFQAARQAGVKTVVFASSETVLGLPFDTPPPYVPVDEEYPPRPETTYSLGKALEEEMARQFCRWDPALKMAALRFSNVMEPADYERFPGYDADPRARKWNLWGYIDARDGAQAIAKAIEAPFTGLEVFIIANADTVMSRPNGELLAEVFPGVPVKRPFGPNETLLSIEKARRVLGYAPAHDWRRR
jgi:nucleoside-diphosphate-sugar epimerase